VKMTLDGGGWVGPQLEGSEVFENLFYKIEDAPADTLVVRVKRRLLETVGVSGTALRREDCTERITLLTLGRIAAVGREHVSKFVGSDMKHPTLAISLDERDADELRRLPGARVCRYQRSMAGDLFCAVAKSPVSKRTPVETTPHLCAGCALPDTRLACMHLQHAIVGIVPGEPPFVLQAQCGAGRNEVRDAPNRCRPGGHPCWAKSVEFVEIDRAPELNGAKPQGKEPVMDQKFGILLAPKRLEAGMSTALGAQGAALIYLDIDHFKQLNSRYTERVVDKSALPQFQRLIVEMSRGHGLAYAEGGDEIIVLIPNCSPSMAIAIATDFITKVRSETFPVGEANERMTISLGLAVASSDQEVALLPERANIAKKYSKDHGRDRASLWTPLGCRPCPSATQWPVEQSAAGEPSVREDPPSYGTLEELHEERERSRRGR